MTDDGFEIWLKSTLVPAERPPDRDFTLKVDALVRLDQRLGAESKAALAGFAHRALGFAAVAAALVWLVRSPRIDATIADSPDLAVAGLIAILVMLVPLIAGPRHSTAGSRAAKSEA
ncbi:hypothetical protein [Sphingomonas mesophila]|uniref:hypothetical protein n=1 Tax=Sphingomonas mesophila TaxID=2303576 RepID=UPI000E58CF11|nr:hypothetical protein [Sphingomonas mesophila]